MNVCIYVCMYVCIQLNEMISKERVKNIKSLRIIDILLSVLSLFVKIKNLFDK